MRLTRFVLLTFVCLMSLVACRRQEEVVPTVAVEAVAPEAVDVTNTPETISAPIPTNTPVPTPSGADPVETAAIDWPPQIVYSSPAPGEEVLLDGAITVRFDQPMDQASVEDGFLITSADDQTKVAGMFTWPDEDTVIFTPSDRFKRRQQYRVRINEARGRNGQEIIEAVRLDLQTVGFLEASQVVPSDGAEAIPVDSAITVLFNRPVIPLVTTGQQEDLPQPLTIEPAVAGQGEWISTSIYRFVPETGLAGATNYVVTIDPDLTDITGGALEETITWRFTTLNPRVERIIPGDGQVDVIPTDSIAINFNMPMNQASTEAAVSIRSNDGNTPTFDYKWSEDGHTLELTPQEPLALERIYQVVIDAAAQAASGQASIGETTLSTFTTVEFPSVESVQPGPNQLADRWQRGFVVRFASPMDMATLEDRILIEPEPARTDYFFNEFNFELNVGFTLKRSTEYIITIPGDAADPYGNTLGQDFTWQFTTPGYDPIASFNLPSQVSQVSTSFVTTLDILHVNVSQLDVAIYDLGLALNLVNAPYELYDFLPDTPSLRTWSLPTEAEQDQLFTTPVYPAGEEAALPTGIYLLTLNAPEVDPQNARYWQNQRHLLIVADTNIVVKEMYDQTHVWVTDLASGQPAAGRNLTLYNERGAPIGTAVSDENGLATFANQTISLGQITVVSNQPGQPGFGMARSSWNTGVDPWSLGLQNVGYEPERPLFAYLYTDRPIYRPGDTMYFKGIVRVPDYGRYSLPEPQTFNLNIIHYNYFSPDSNFEETISVQAGADGSFSGQFTLPEDVQLGTFQINLNTESVNIYRDFTVAEYRRPEFLVTVTPEKAETLRGQTTTATVEARYFFGGAATDLPVQWTIYALPYQLDVPGPYYAFSDAANFFYRSSLPFDFVPQEGPGQFIISGEGTTDGDGRFTIDLPADLLADLEAGSQTVTIEATVSDLSNFPISAQGTVLFHAAETYVGVVAANYIANAGSPTSVDIRTVDWQGQPIPDQAVEVIFYQREWERTRIEEYGTYFTQWEPIDTEVGRGQIQTDQQGEGTVSFTPASGGTYVAVATVTDRNGRNHTSSSTIWVTDATYAGWRTDPKERKMDLIPDKQTYTPGETAQVLVQSPFTGPIQAWLTIDRGRLIEQQLVTLESGSHILDIPISPDYAPNVYVSVVAIRGVNYEDTENPYADIRLGVAELPVSPEQLYLNINLSPRSDRFVPRETVTYDITVTDYLGNPVEAELSLALVDLAVLTLKEDNAPAIDEAFYAPQPYQGLVSSGLFISGESQEEIEVPVEGGGFGGGGGGVEAERAVALDEEQQDGDDSVRREFPDTAFWQAIVKTDSNGQATVEVPLPDTLTTWRLSSKAVTADTLVGQADVDIIVSKPLLLRPVTPRFFTVGDTVEVGAIVNNNSDDAIEATITLEAEGVTLNSGAEVRVSVPAQGQQLVQWQVIVADVDFVDFTFRANGGGFSDATKPSFGQGPNNVIPVHRYNAEDIVGTSGVLSQAGRRVEAILLPEVIDAREGALNIQLDASLAAALIESLEATEDLEYPHVCAHSVANRLLPNVATLQAIQKLALNQPELATRLNDLIQAEITQLIDLAKPQGGWGWCYSQEQDPVLTAHILFSLMQAEAAGYTVPPRLMTEATDYLAGTLPTPDTVVEPYRLNQQIFILYVLAQRNETFPAYLETYMRDYRSQLSPYARALLALTYELTDPLSDNPTTLLSDLNGEVVLSATGAHWEDANRHYRSLSSDIRSTAIVIEALVQLTPDNNLLPQAVRWLMAARQAQMWPTLHETAWSIFALTNWMAATGELEADYQYTLAVNTTQQAQGNFASADILTGESLSLPISELVLDDVNYLDFQRTEGNGRLYYTVHLDSFIPAESVTAVSRGMSLQRAYYDAACDPDQETCEPITQIQAGQQVRVELTLVAPNNGLYVTLEDYFPAGTEAIDSGLATSASGFGGGTTHVDEPYRYGYWGWWYFNRIEYRDDRIQFFANFLPAGTYQYTYFLQATIPGEYQVRPSLAQQEFFPEVFGRADGMRFAIVE